MPNIKLMKATMVDMNLSPMQEMIFDYFDKFRAEISETQMYQYKLTISR